jgi:hypothetical protein
MGSCCTAIDKPPKFAYVTTDYTNLKGIVDTTLFGDKVYKRVCVVSSESFQILLIIFIGMPKIKRRLIEKDGVDIFL